MKRESFGSRIGFILVSAGCAVGLGNVWKFPYMCGAYGGAIFILIYLLFLVILCLPVLVCEFAVGRASRMSVAKSFDTLEPDGTRWHLMKYIGMIGCYLLMMFYTMVGGWMLYYCFRSLRGDFTGASSETIQQYFSDMLADPGTMIFWTVLICVIGFSVCAIGLQKGIERITKVMMTLLFIVMIALAVRSVTMPGSSEGIRFYLVPDIDKMLETGIGNVLFGALSQAFFTLSIGIGAMLIFGSYLDKSNRLAGEAISIGVLDTLVALTAGLIVIPSCFAYGIQPDAGPSLVFITLPNIFSQMTAGGIWSALFFLFLTFAALSTIIAVFENLVAINMDLLGWSRKKSTLVCAVLIIILSMPCVLGYNILSGVQPLGEGSTIMDLEDFLVSNNLLPLGSMGILLFCTRKNGWGWDNFKKEADTGNGIKLPSFMRPLMSYIIPAAIMIIFLKGYYDKFSGQGTALFITWMTIGILLLAFVLFCASGSSKNTHKNTDK
ncbi:MAG: sodium-dependent transporter [Anaerovoracaceae bacterium]|nr:sodium-dependent transporter [Bacillota bacterium]MDD7733463.1 sodium-dependent transporter [Bacillota bacterium]MDY5906914.1 sodium-dependent transporter [Anaerovoracaceae bacterium]